MKTKINLIAIIAVILLVVNLCATGDAAPTRLRAIQMMQSGIVPGNVMTVSTNAVDIYGVDPSSWGGTDELVKCSATDTTADYLFSKLAGGTGINISLTGGGMYEIVSIATSGVATDLDSAYNNSPSSNKKITADDGPVIIDHGGLTMAEIVLQINGTFYQSEGGSATFAVPSVYFGDLDTASELYQADGSGNYINFVMPSISADFDITWWDSLPGTTEMVTMTDAGVLGHAAIPAAASAPVGSVMMFAGSSAPSGYLICNGAAVSETTYSALFAIVGHSYGGDPGGGNFNLPNMSEKFVAGVGSTGYALGNTGGAATHDHSYTPSGSNSTSSVTGTAGTLYGTIMGMLGFDTMPDPAHTYDVTGTADAQTFTGVQADTSSESIIPPYVVCNYIIKY